MAEREPSKLDMRVRFPSPAPRFADGFKRARPCGSVVEHSLGKGEVASSILAMGTIGGALRYITTLLVCVASLCNAARCVWIPAFAGMTGIVKSGARLMAVVALFFVVTLATSANAEEQKEYGMVCENWRFSTLHFEAHLPGLEKRQIAPPEVAAESQRFLLLVQSVNKMMEEGWQPLGSAVSVPGITYPDDTTLCQTIVRKK